VISEPIFPVQRTKPTDGWQHAVDGRGVPTIEDDDRAQKLCETERSSAVCNT